MASDEKEKLIRHARERGHRLTSKQIDRWRLERLLPQPGARSAGRGRGVQRPSAEGTAKQLVALCDYLAQDRSLDRAALRLWIDGYPVPLDRVRKSLQRSTPDPSRLTGIAPGDLSKDIDDFCVQLADRKRVSERTREMADDGTLQPLFTKFLSLSSGQVLPEEEAREFGRAFERFSGMDRGRTDHWEGKSPWLTDDPASPVKNLARVLPLIKRDAVANASAAEMHKARDGFLAWEKMVRCTELLEKLHGANVFGFGSLTKPPLGQTPYETNVVMFVGMLAFVRLQPVLVDGVIEMGRTLDASLSILSQQVGQATKSM